MLRELQWVASAGTVSRVRTIITKAFKSVLGEAPMCHRQRRKAGAT